MKSAEKAKALKAWMEDKKIPGLSGCLINLYEWGRKDSDRAKIEVIGEHELFYNWLEASVS